MSEKTVAQMQREILSMGRLELEYCRFTSLYEAVFIDLATAEWLKFSASTLEALIEGVWNTVCD